MTDESRTSRNEMLFGAQGQRLIREARVAIVGLGGLGCHVAQQLAYLGTEDFLLADHDHVTASSLNRLIGAGPDDVAAMSSKVAVAERVIRMAQPSASIDAFESGIEDEAVKAAVQTCSVVFGCVDNDVARLTLVELTSAQRLPYFDLATDVSDDGAAFGGRLLVSLDGERCLFCMGMLDQRQLREATQTPEQRAADDRIYGVRRSALEGTGPSVVSINGALASLAVTEFMVWITGMRLPWRYLVYHGARGIVTASQDRRAAHCPYCGR
jgi:molybdopterin-synthase adenylyltransferase